MTSIINEVDYIHRRMKELQGQPIEDKPEEDMSGSKSQGPSAPVDMSEASTTPGIKPGPLKGIWAGKKTTIRTGLPAPQWRKYITGEWINAHSDG
jgi:hypothetical protein